MTVLLRRTLGFVLRLPVAVVVLYVGLVAAYAVGAGYGYRIGLVLPTPLNMIGTMALAITALTVAASIAAGRWAGPRQLRSLLGIFCAIGAAITVWAVAGAVVLTALG
jgi:hypothetical protein